MQTNLQLDLTVGCDMLLLPWQLETECIQMTLLPAMLFQKHHVK